MGSIDGRNGFALEAVSLRRASRDIFRALDFYVAPGEIHALVGAKGMGKSMLCALLAGDVEPDSGRVSVPPGIRAARITDSTAVFPRMSIADNLILDRDSNWLSWLRLGKAQRSRLRRWLDERGVDIPFQLPLRTLPREDWLFVQILNRLYREPDLILFDEALESLTPSRLQQLWPIIEERRGRGASVLWVTNRVESALVKADRVSILRNGRILLTESTRRLDRLGLISLCHGFLEVPGDDHSSQEQFQQIVRFTDALLRDLPSAVIMTDMAGAVRFVNRRGGEFFGLAEQWMRNQTLETVLGRANARLAAALGEALLAGDEREWHGLALEVADGRRLVDVRTRRVREGEVEVGHLVVIEDVSIREEMRRRLMLSENVTSVGLLAAGVAHEVNNPLEAMENYLNYLGETEPAAERREIIGEVIRETHSIKDTVRQLVAFSGHRDAGRVKTDMAVLVKRLCSLLRYHVKGKGIAFDFVWPGERALVVAAPNEMRQMLLNLIRNGIDAMPSGGVITIALVVETEGKGPRLRLTIDDEGCGIEPDRLADVFLPFVSGKRDQDNHQGLGLWIVYTIVENCGGSIAVENRREGGCRFTVHLPCLVESGQNGGGA